jgi:hypothetical protein
MAGLGDFLVGLERTTRGIPQMVQNQGMMALQLAQAKQKQTLEEKKMKEDKAFNAFSIGLKLVNKDNPTPLRQQGLGLMKQAWTSLYPEADMSSLDNVNFDDKAFNTAIQKLDKHLEKVKKGEADRASIPTFTIAAVQEYNLNKEQAENLIEAGKTASTALKESQAREDKLKKETQDRVDKARKELYESQFKETPEERHNWEMRLAQYKEDLSAPYKETPQQKEDRLKRIAQFEADLQAPYKETPEEREARERRMAGYQGSIQLENQTIMARLNAALKEPTPTNLNKMLKERDALPKEDPNREIYDKAIGKAISQKGMQIQINSDGSTTITEGPLEGGKIMPASEVGKIGEFKAYQETLSEIETMINKGTIDTGPFEFLKEKLDNWGVMPKEERIQLRSMVARLPGLMYAMRGKQLSDKELEVALKMMPKMNTTEQVFINDVKKFTEFMRLILSGKEEAFSGAGYGTGAFGKKQGSSDMDQFWEK